MAELLLCDPSQLYNLLNQTHGPKDYPDISDPTYLLLIDAREGWEYNESHITTATHLKWTSHPRSPVLPYGTGISTMRYIVVYDSRSSTLVENGPALECAQKLAKERVEPVHILKGGYERFSAVYPFLRSQKSLHTVHELENCQMWPLEFWSELAYLGRFIHARNEGLICSLKIRAVLTIGKGNFDPPAHVEHKHVVVSDAETGQDMDKQYKEACTFLDAHVSKGARILIACRSARNLSAAMAMAFLINTRSMSVKEAYSHVLQSQTQARPHRHVIEQLSRWEAACLGTKEKTDISSPQD